ncbi:HlyU family transcriptional regulator [Vibrio rumoiensis]|uniref:Transcriptional regulator n=1 Tax=Vibrio rumoiensis 1S-45 TaxID=1188252 RepID=A0A1E5DZX3_9VIBR|nr:HlyU family transcriptional regulator [Vibrio rumoiensis]OEF23220.1 transcriptional regulator [Vibrio rumoiensis 1S-45]
MGFLSKLFGAKEVEAKNVEPVEYNGYLIYPEPMAEGGQFRIAGRIVKDIQGEMKTYQFIRSDVLASESDANELMIKKAKLFIDQSGTTIF